MGVQEKLITNSAGYLEPGEPVFAALRAQTLSQWLMLPGLVPIILGGRMSGLGGTAGLIGFLLLVAGLVAMVIFLVQLNYVIVLVTDRRALVLDAGRWTPNRPNGVRRLLGLPVRLGPWSGTIWHTTSGLGEKLWVHRKFRGDIGRADAVPPLSSPPYGGPPAGGPGLGGPQYGGPPYGGPPAGGPGFGGPQPSGRSY